MSVKSITGCYKQKSIEMFIKKTSGNIPVVAVFIHGLYGVFDQNEPGDKLNILINSLTAEGVAHCVSFNTSRDFSFSTKTEYGERKNAFKEKTFIQELGDVKKVASWIINNSEDTFGITKDDLILYVHGTSLGGTFAVLLGDFYSKIKKISLCGSGCGTNGSTKPILSTMFSEADILKPIKTFKGEIFLLQGSEDTQVPLESGLKILKHATSARTSHNVVFGANHNFSKLHGIENDKVEQEFISKIFDFLKK
ncbi:MAG: alpha/beta hydrolase family protein [Minisyncoccota bacterium]